ncbi:MAG TPA: ATP-binding protein [Planctomycetota bacterium]|nr:ATP-binding protein [Planctomycetota bacterium]
MATARVEQLFSQHLHAIHVRTDRLFAMIMGLQWLGAIFAALIISPRAWEGSQYQTHVHVYAALFLGGAIVSLPIALALLCPGKLLTRHVVAIGQMLMSALLIHLTGGRIETHFHVFGSLAFLAFYRDWRVLVSASIVVAVDHYLRGAYWPISVYGVVAAGQWRWLEHVWWVVFEDVFLFMAISQSIQEMRAMAERQARVEYALVEAENANRAKDEFLATLSHELRTPMTSLFGWTDILRKNENRDEATLTRGLGVIDRNLRALMRLIEDLLDVSRIVAGKFALETKPILLNTVVENAVESIRPAAEGKSIELSLEMRADIVVQGDAPRLQQVIWNLLSNAVKFTPKHGKVCLRAELSGGQAMLTVSDTGKGMPAEFLPHIFKRFQQADGSITRASGGLGLGLAIVRHIVELHGGSVKAASAGPGQGSVFTVALPAITNAVILRPPGRQPEVAAAHNSRILDGVTVLVVEDEPDSRELITLVLQRSGAQVLAARSSAEALELLESHRPDVLISDIGMPVEDGYTLIKKVRAREAELGRHVPAAALTAYAKSEDRAAAIAAGFEEHVAKPIQPERLPAFVAQLARSRNSGSDA